MAAKNVTMLRKVEREVEVFCPHCGELVQVTATVHIRWQDGEVHVFVDPSASGLTKAHICRR
jgi:hypothetical protein